MNKKPVRRKKRHSKAGVLAHDSGLATRTAECEADKDPWATGPEVRHRHTVSRPHGVNPAPPRRLYLYSRPHIDLLRVTSALCRS
ncbi:putative leader peptide [Streptomyces chartreusis]|uniref:putative leader peptide n=1 Tax=Streptomyces chartreusis TaxID=1969 RepID=UPI0034E60809